jgi:beta-glucosidase
VADNCNNTIVVINTIGPRLLSNFSSHKNVTGVLYGGPLGQSSGHAIAATLFGDANPSGKLVHTLANNESDYAGFEISEADEIEFSEGNYIDYKFFDRGNTTVDFPFGFGLSYTSFKYGSSLSIAPHTALLSHTFAKGARAVGGREDLWDTVAIVSTFLTNTGSVLGAEVAQLYIEFPATANEPVRQLRGFQKVMLKPGQKGDVQFKLRRRDLSVWDTVAQEWAIVRGTYTMRVGTSSRDMRVAGTLTV